MCVWTRIDPGQKIFEIGWGGWGTPHRPTFLTCMETTLKSGAILMKFTQDVCMDEKISWTTNFENWTGGRGTPNRLIFLTCMEPTLKDAAILMKFTTWSIPKCALHFKFFFLFQNVLIISQKSAHRRNFHHYFIFCK